MHATGTRQTLGQAKMVTEECACHHTAIDFNRNAVIKKARLECKFVEDRTTHRRTSRERRVACHCIFSLTQEEEMTKKCAEEENKNKQNNSEAPSEQQLFRQVNGSQTDSPFNGLRDKISGLCLCMCLSLAVWPRNGQSGREQLRKNHHLHRVSWYTHTIYVDIVWQSKLCS